MTHAIYKSMLVAMKTLIDLYLRLFAFWMKFPEKIRYVLVGGYNTVISYLLYALFLWILDGLYEQIALFFSFIVSSLNSYWTQKIYVFNTRGNIKREYFKCLISWGISYALNVILLFLFVKMVGMNPYVGQFFALILVTINSYLMLKKFAFKVKK